VTAATIPRAVRVIITTDTKWNQS